MCNAYISLARNYINIRYVRASSHYPGTLRSPVLLLPGLQFFGLGLILPSLALLRRGRHVSAPVSRCDVTTAPHTSERRTLGQLPDGGRGL
ncbi:hypothetical protein FKM82_010545 [Ascaphus truei]